MKNVFLTLMFLFWFILPAQAQIQKVVVEIEGMTCPFCNFGVEKILDKVDGVQKVAVDLKKGAAVLNAKPKESIHIDQIHPAIKKAGFKVLSIRLEAVGAPSADSQGDIFIRSIEKQKPIHFHNFQVGKDKNLDELIKNKKFARFLVELKEIKNDQFCVQLDKITDA